MSLSITATPISAATDKSRDIASRASTSIGGEESGISVVCSLPRCRIVIANLVKGAARASGCDTSFCSRTCAMPTEPSLTSAVRRSEWLGKIIRRKLIPSLEHVTWRDPTVTPSRLAISSRLIPSPTNSLIFSIACGVNLARLPLTDEMAFVIVMAAPFGSRPVVVVYTPNTQDPSTSCWAVFFGVLAHLPQEKSRGPMMNFPSCSCACAVDIATANASTANRSSWYMVLSAHVPGLIDLFRRYSCIFHHGFWIAFFLAARDLPTA